MTSCLSPLILNVLPRTVSLTTRFSRNIELHIPFVTAAMDTVTEAPMAIAIAREGGIGVIQSIAAMKDLWAYSGVNRFNDADMMCVAIHGTGKSSSDLCLTGPGMTQDEYRTQFALWCMWSSPLTPVFRLDEAPLCR